MFDFIKLLEGKQMVNVMLFVSGKTEFQRQTTHCVILASVLEL